MGACVGLNVLATPSGRGEDVVGILVGPDEGKLLLGEELGTVDGAPLGCEDGIRLGRHEGLLVGWLLGWLVGCRLGVTLGIPVGCADG
jgi:hypothetical protein